MGSAELPADRGEFLGLLSKLREFSIDFAYPDLREGLVYFDNDPAANERLVQAKMRALRGVLAAVVDAAASPPS